MDLGTTTVVLRLIDLESRELIADASFENPQRFGGSDVMSRIESRVRKMIETGIDFGVVVIDLDPIFGECNRKCASSADGRIRGSVLVDEADDVVEDEDAFRLEDIDDFPEYEFGDSDSVTHRHQRRSLVDSQLHRRIKENLLFIRVGCKKFILAVDGSMTSSSLQRAFAGKKAWVSGHTGFKGSWLSEWLLSLGAEVYGYALAPPTSPSLFHQLGLAHRIQHERGDLRDGDAVKKSIRSLQPDFVFHLGAQAIVRTSFLEPVETYATNVLGTIHVMEALRGLEKPCALVLITTDKCYENRECVQSYREDDSLGGYDPYSSSKAAAEIAINSWRRSFFADHPVSVASVRAGNVIGGGDWAKDRIVPDCIRALQRGEAIGVRNKTSTRPWQHVLEPLSGYLWLGAVLADPSLRPFDRGVFRSAFNLGPALEANRTVLELVTEVIKHWPGRWQDKSDPNAVHEAKLLNLATDRAFHFLGWRPVWNFEKAIATTVKWYRSVHEAGDASQEHVVGVTRKQIEEYSGEAAEAALPWATETRAATGEK